MKIFKQLSLNKYFDNMKHNSEELAGPLLQASSKADKFGPCRANYKFFFGYLQNN